MHLNPKYILSCASCHVQLVRRFPITVPGWFYPSQNCCCQSDLIRVSTCRCARSSGHQFCQMRFLSDLSVFTEISVNLELSWKLQTTVISSCFLQYEFSWISRIAEYLLYIATPLQNLLIQECAFMCDPWITQGQGGMGARVNTFPNVTNGEGRVMKIISLLWPNFAKIQLKSRYFLIISTIFTTSDQQIAFVGNFANKGSSGIM